MRLPSVTVSHPHCTFLGSLLTQGLSTFASRSSTLSRNAPKASTMSEMFLVDERFTEGQPLSLPARFVVTSPLNITYITRRLRNIMRAEKPFTIITRPLLFQIVSSSRGLREGDGRRVNEQV